MWFDGRSHLFVDLRHSEVGVFVLVNETDHLEVRQLVEFVVVEHVVVGRVHDRGHHPLAFLAGLGRMRTTTIAKGARDTVMDRIGCAKCDFAQQPIVPLEFDSFRHIHMRQARFLVDFDDLEN